MHFRRGRLASTFGTLLSSQGAGAHPSGSLDRFGGNRLTLSARVTRVNQPALDSVRFTSHPTAIRLQLGSPPPARAVRRRGRRLVWTRGGARRTGPLSGPLAGPFLPAGRRWTVPGTPRASNSAVVSRATPLFAGATAGAAAARRAASTAGPRQGPDSRQGAPRQQAGSPASCRAG